MDKIVKTKISFVTLCHVFRDSILIPKIAQTDTLCSSLPPKSTSKKKSSKSSSKVWNHFTKIKGYDPNYLRVTCNYNGINYACHNKRNGTTTMEARLFNKCKKKNPI